MGKYIYRSASELATLIRDGKATSFEIVTEHLNRIKEHNHELNALISVFEEQAIDEARQCDEEYKTGKLRGILHGVPVTVKEQFWLKGIHSNTNFNLLKKFVAPEDSVLIDRIKKSGAIILGQTNVPKTLIDYQVKGDIYAEGKNPYNTGYTPGGSTGGGAAALAAGFTPLELGSDIGGSIRVPANFCGLYGFKPTEKTIPLHGNIPVPKNTNTCIFHMMQAGPLARNVEDLETLWRIIVGPHASDRGIPDINWKPASDKLLADYKVAWTDSWPGYETSNITKTRMHELVEQLQLNGCRADQTIPDETLHKNSLEVFCGLFPFVIAQGTPWYVREIIKWQLKKGLANGMYKKYPEFKKIFYKAFQLNANYYGEVMLKRNLVIERWENFFEKYDFLICPVSFGPAYKRCKTGEPITFEGKSLLYINYVWPYVACFNASGHPCMTIPLGLNEDGLPVGVQVVTKYWNEPELLHLAKQLSSITPGFIKPPGY